jgi:hypothetical protein
MHPLYVTQGHVLVTCTHCGGPHACSCGICFDCDELILDDFDSDELGIDPEEWD